MTDTAFDKRCEWCGDYDLALSHIHIDFNYGSKNDGKSITLAVCGNCIDKIYEYILTEREEKSL